MNASLDLGITDAAHDHWLCATRPLYSNLAGKPVGDGQGLRIFNRVKRPGDVGTRPYQVSPA
ncbi:hypothetical protein [Actinomadura sp. 7K507]|uniref:hypothetical protein n=1 Tax=Actinomadura sp. 7K507 TaxID=2530365 RepID=UPI0010521A98|nr:hypothetical protein [Actinomadura sp. 7K507]TDC98383.1 hypothetical protein E1285_00155 [Actinomadura sp. 7K507]